MCDSISIKLLPEATSMIWVKSSLFLLKTSLSIEIVVEKSSSYHHFSMHVCGSYRTQTLKLWRYMKTIWIYVCVYKILSLKSDWPLHKRQINLWSGDNMAAILPWFSWKRRFVFPQWWILYIYTHYLRTTSIRTLSDA